MKAKIEDADHLIVIIADEDPHELSDIALYGTEAMAKEAHMTLEEYREQIINACFLDDADPIAKWKEVFAYQETIKAKLNTLKIQSVHLTGEDIDLIVKI